MAVDEMEWSKLDQINGNVAGHTVIALSESWLGSSTSGDNRSHGGDERCRGAAVNLQPLLGLTGNSIH